MREMTRLEWIYRVEEHASQTSGGGLTPVRGPGEHQPAVERKGPKQPLLLS